MRADFFALGCSLLVSVAGCGSTPAAEVSGPAVETLAVDTGAFDAPVGDSFTCFYTSTITEREISAANVIGTQPPGGHHMIVYYSTDKPKAPTSHPCDDAEMQNWQQIGGISTGEPVVAVPDGAAVKIPKGAQIVLQSHYINTTSGPLHVRDQAKVVIVEPSAVKQYLNYWAFVNVLFDIPPNGDQTAVSTCRVQKDLNVVLLLGHMHELGKHFKLEQIDDAGKSLATLYDTKWSPEFTSHPPLIKRELAAPFVIKSGTRLRQTCDWHNSTPQEVKFPREMCVSFAYYYPDEGFTFCKLD